MNVQRKFSTTFNIFVTFHRQCSKYPNLTTALALGSKAKLLIVDGVDESLSSYNVYFVTDML